MTRSCRLWDSRIPTSCLSPSISVFVGAISDTGAVLGCDYLLCQFAVDKKLSTLESLPAEILEPILEEVSLSIRITRLIMTSESSI